MNVGIDVGGTKCLGLVVDQGGSVAGQRRVATPSGSEALVATVAGLVTDLASEADGDLTIGVGVPGLVDMEGVLRFAPNLAGVVDLGLREALEDRFPGSVVRIENDASCAAWAERQLGAARGTDHAVLATLGTGIGGGVITQGGLLRGGHGYAGEIGHMVVDPHGPPCPCGQQGCWERFASGSGLGTMGREAARAHAGRRLVELAGGDPENVRGEHVTAAAAEGDDEAKAVMDSFGWWVAVGLLNLANVLDPELFVLGGGLVAAGDLLLAPTRTAFDRLVQGLDRRPRVPVVAAELGERAGAIGAALLAREEGAP